MRAYGLNDQSELYQEVLQIDAIGLVCPLPILRFKKRTQGLPSGTQIEFLTDDPSGRRDLQTLCKLTGHRIEWIREEDVGVIRYRICLA
ncbi:MULTISPECIES: sulfurtransferase TusA family protein [unclassified Marinobacter]|uniref:sulfurtransferase TusA family protein n=1 Tax=unclassified Marinobacter TaxID=83889 RepID=UPI000C00E9E2|nr:MULTISPECIES: sulfurtransferase TusA family protein [unclassified Marinobacter]PFG11090.1 tRNA 2-thiouridine synthesizing protein A [Marinobacter sp. LV10MA510-1]PFG52982.1 tRNA 2-thiouridine synthesizing protein A [Marinobacter sp. LV10R520-4]